MPTNQQRIESRKLRDYTLLKLPRVHFKGGLKLAERAEITLKNPRASIMVYVMGYFESDRDFYLVHGDNLQDGRVYQTGVTDIECTLFERIANYRPLPRPRLT